MGHLSSLDRVATTKVATAKSKGCTVGSSIVGDGDSSDGDVKSSHHSTIVNSELKYTKVSNNKRSENSNDLSGNGFPLNGNKLNGSSCGQTTVETTYVKPKHTVDLEEYTRNFKGDTFMGIQFKAPLKWDKIYQITLLHLVFVVTFFLYDLREFNLMTVLFAFVTGGLAGFGVTGGAHRLWTHRSFKANVPLRIILMGCFSLAGQNTLYDWVRDHRVHHKFSETDADPHNSNRGFFFAHVGWLMMYKHPEVLRRGRQIDMSDVLSDPVVQFHQKYFIPLKMLLCFVIPTLIPVYGWDEHWYWAFTTQCIVRYVFSLNFTWSVNSAAHMWGYRPYDKRINPSESLCVSIIAMGEGWHNYHHVFPWDYKAAELGKYSVNLTTMYLDFFARIGWAWDMKQPSKELVRRTIEKYGDGTHDTYGHHHHMPEIPDPTEGDANLDAELRAEEEIVVGGCGRSTSCSEKKKSFSQYDENKNFKKD